MGNITALAILLGVSFEIGQSTVLFALLMTENKNRLLAWSMMFLLTGVQISANVFATFKFMDTSGSNDWTFWQRSILFAVQADSPEMYKVIISWIQGSVLPLISLGMTGLITENLHIMRGDRTEEIKKEEVKEEKEEPKSLFDIFKKKNAEEEKTPEIKDQEIKKDSVSEQDLNRRMKSIFDGLSKNINIKPSTSETKIEEEQINTEAQHDSPLYYLKPKKEFEEIKPQIDIDLTFDKGLEEPNTHDEEIPIASSVLEPTQDDLKSVDRPELSVSSMTVTNKDIEDLSKVNAKIFPINKPRGWRLMNEFVDDEHNVFSKGKFIKKDILKTPTSKKA